MDPDVTTSPVSANHQYFRIGDAKALDIYPPEFFVKQIRQDNPFPGMPNRVTVSLAANVDLVFPAAITISGLLIDESIRGIQGQILHPLGPITLTDVTDPTSKCEITSGTDGYTCTNGAPKFKATPQSSSSSQGMFDDEYGRIVLNLGDVTLEAGHHIVFQFEVTNPFCGQPAAVPCVRANRIMTNDCEPAAIPRARMSVEPISTVDMRLPAISTDVTDWNDRGESVIVPQALPGEALPLFTRNPNITLARIGQSTAYPCASNTITITVATNVPLVQAVGMNVTVSGLKGFRTIGGTNMPVAMAGPASGSISITRASDSVNNGPDSDDVFAASGAWNLEAGELIIGVEADSMAGKEYVFSFDLQNPSEEQQCANVFLKISTFCFGDPIRMESSNTLDEGLCAVTGSVNFNEPEGINWQAESSEAHLRCPLRVVQAVLVTRYIEQASQFPCTDNTIQVVLSSNVPLRNCAPQVTISGLSNTMTNSTSDMQVSIVQPSTSTEAAIWRREGALSLDASNIVPDTACDVFEFTFVVKNQMSPRSSTAVHVHMAGILNFALDSVLLTVPSGLNDWYSSISLARSATVAAWKDPLFVLAPAFTKRIMGQTTPWPGTVNTLHVTIATNVPLWAECSTLMILNLEGACSQDGSKDLGGTDASDFEDQAGTDSKGTYLSVRDEDRNIDVGKLIFIPTTGTSENTDYTFSFQVNNPVLAQNSPGIQIEALGIPIVPTLFQKDTTTVLTSPCDSVSLACKWTAGDAAPLKVFAPMFLQKDISQSIPYPMKTNTITVTLMTNIPLTVGTLITLSNLNGAITPTGEVALDGTDDTKFHAGSGSGESTAYWDSEYKKLTLRVKVEVAAGALTSFTFNLQNPPCNQPSPAVCVRASRISTTCLDCSQGQCVTLTRQSMDRDYVTILGYGDKGHPNHGNSAYYSPGAVVTYAQEPPQSGDAAPLHIYAPEFVVSNITQSNPYPGGENVITATISTSVPLVQDSIITISGLKGLVGSKTASNPAMQLSASSSVFSTDAEWSNDGSEACVVIYGESNYDCAALCPAGFICRDSIQPSNSPSGFTIDSNKKDCLTFTSSSQCPQGSQKVNGLPSMDMSVNWRRTRAGLTLA